MKIAAYCRVSTDKKEQQESLQNQKAFFTEYARRNGHALARIYADEGITGTSLKKREAFKELLHDAQAGFFEMVVVKDVSRFARNTVDALQSVRRLKSLGINTLFINAGMSAIGDGEFVLTLFSAMAQEESNNTSKRVKWGKRINAERGRVPPRVFGYDKVDNFTLAVNGPEARVVRKIFSLYIDHGLGCRSISMELNREGDRTKFGGAWDARGVRRILTNPLYGGVLVNHKYEIADFLTGRQVTVPEQERFYHERPDWAIVSPEVFAQAQQILAERRKQYDSGEPFRQGRHSAKHVFSTLIKCAHCGRSFTRKSYTYANTRVYWRCVTNDQYTAERCDNHTIVEEKTLLEELRKHFSSCVRERKAFAEKVLTELDRQRPEDDPERIRKDIEGKRKKLQSRRSRCQEMYAEELITMEELKEKLTGIAGELQTLEQELEQRCRQADGRADTADRVWQETERFLNLETLTNMELRRLVEHILVSRDGTVRVKVKKLENLSFFHNNSKNG